MNEFMNGNTNWNKITESMSPYLRESRTVKKTKNLTATFNKNVISLYSVLKY